MDVVDQAQKQTDLELELSLQKREQSLLSTGACYYCDAVIDKGCFCDADCRDDYEKMVRL